jgi:hypothetical protein
MLVAAQGGDDPPEAEPPECEGPDDAGDDGNPATRLRFSLPSELGGRPEKG